MPNDQVPVLQQQKQLLSAEQEQQVVGWVSKERSCGTVVRHDFIHWFAVRIIQRDGVEERLGSDFAHDFLRQHPDLAKRLIVPPHPHHEKPKDIGTARRSAFDRLKERMQQDRRQALFGDSPPPRRQPAPYPEGDILYHFVNRYVVRHGDSVTKYTTCLDWETLGRHLPSLFAKRYDLEYILMGFITSLS